MANFFDTYAAEPIKIFVIDSAEKLSEINNQTVLNDLITKLSTYGWKIIFTTRSSYLDDLQFHLNESYNLNCKTLKLSQISNQELNEISDKFDIELPKNEIFKDRIRNLFYLNEYVKYQSDETVENFADFIDLLWKKKIQNKEFIGDDIHIERGRCFLEIAKKRAQTGSFYNDGRGLSQKALAGLKQDEILGYDDKHDSYFITHDIYEEWALNRIIDQAYLNDCTPNIFFETIENNLPIRRAFRNWLSQQLLENNNTELKKFVKDVFKHPSIEQFWKDELLISVLLSNYPEEFFQLFEENLLANDFYIIKRIIFLLRLACNEVSDLLYGPKPKGDGWNATIEFIYKHKDSFFTSYYGLVLPLLLDWCLLNHQGATTQMAGLLALQLLDGVAQGKLYLNGKTEELVHKIIFVACSEIEDELTKIFNFVIEHKLVEYNQPYNKLCSIIVKKSYQAGRLIQLLPKQVIVLCELFWFDENYNKSPYGNYDLGVEVYYGIYDSSLDYFPAGAYQTPTWWLLNSKEFLSAIDFIISFTNETVENYANDNSKSDRIIETTITVNGNEITQFHSNTLWMMYRGSGSPVTPYLLQSMHMALEKKLLEIAKTWDSKTISTLLLRILLNAKSSSLTSVVCSIVLAYPNKFENIALILFSSKDVFHADLSRSLSDNSIKSLYSIGYGLNQIDTIFYKDERLKTCEDEHRKDHLANLCLRYLFDGVEGYSAEENANFFQTIYNILDNHHASFTDSVEDVSKSILFTRMDIRKLKPQFIEDKKEMHFSAELTEEQEILSKASQAHAYYQNKHAGIELWSSLRGERYCEAYKIYDENPLLALEEVKKLIQDLKNDNSDKFIPFNKSTPYKVCAKLIIEHSDKLSEDERKFCKDNIIASIQRLTLDNYDYQISDGMEECTHALPKLIELFPNDKEDFIGLFLLVLFNQHSIGEYKRICDYAIESLHNHNLWRAHPDIANQILYAYIKYKPLLNQAILELRNSQNNKANINEEISARFEKFPDLYEKYSKNNENDLALDIHQLANLEIEDLEIVLQILPDNTDDDAHLAILNKIIPEMAYALLKDEDRHHADENLNWTRLKFFEKLSRILLMRKSEDQIYKLAQALMTNFKLNEYVSDFIKYIIQSEDTIKSNDNFWYIWKLLYKKIIELSSHSNFNNPSNDSIITNYLLAWRYWGKKQTSWHSLERENLWLFEDISNDFPNHPAVLYSITRVLYTVGSNFHEEGIHWLYNIVFSNPKIELGDLESNTLFYLEVILRQYIFKNREKIKRDLQLKNKIIEILNFMIERASVHGYSLRENIL